MASSFMITLLAVACHIPATALVEEKVAFRREVQVNSHARLIEEDPVRREKLLKEPTSAEIDALDYFRPGLAPAVLTQRSAAWPGMDDQAVSPPCTRACAQAAKSGIVFVGDSTTRRLYVRLVSRLARLTNEQSEMLQDNAKQWSHHAGNIPLSQFRDASGEVPFKYTKGGMNVRFEWDSQYLPENITKKLKDAQTQSYRFVFVGLPLAHMLHWEGHPSLACDAGPKFPTELENKFEQLVKLDDTTDVRVVFGNGVPFANGDRLLNLTCAGLGRMQVEKCTVGACDWIRCNSHMKKANDVYQQAFTRLSKAHMRHADLTAATTGSKLWRYRLNGLSDGGVHYKYSILDEQLDLILKEMMD